MSARHSAWAALLLLSLACRKETPPDDPGGAPSQPVAPPDQEAPVPLNGEAPIQYPPRLFDQRVEGEVVLRLFADSTGRLKPESSKVAESSGYPALDSAAVSVVAVALKKKAPPRPQTDLAEIEHANELGQR